MRGWGCSRIYGVFFCVSWLCKIQYIRILIIHFNVIYFFRSVCFRFNNIAPSSV